MFEVTSTALGASDGEWRFSISDHIVQSGDEIRRHKTDWREFYDAEHERAAKRGRDEVIFLNERGELSEGSRTNLFLQRDGALLTPAASSGLLDGCLRRELLDLGSCCEAILYKSDLERAERIFLGNSLRGLIPAIFESA